MTDVQQRPLEQTQTAGISESLARFVVETETSSIPADVMHASRRAIMDTIGVALAGSLEPASRIVADHASDRSNSAESVIWGTGLKVSAADAAVANGTASHVLDFDDTHGLMRGHPSVTILPAVTAMGERVGASGAEVMAAFAIGVEVACRLGQLTGSGAYDRGWHMTALHGTLGAAAGAGRLAGLRVDQMQVALGLAASYAGGVRQNFGTMTKSFHIGRAAESGIRAVELVQRGFTASPEAIEGEVGYLAVLGRSDELSADDLRATLGNPFALVAPGVNVKVYPSCAFTNPAIDLALDLGGDLKPEDIDRIVVEVVYGAPLILIHHRPTEPLAAKFSLEYCVAAALVDGAVTLSHFTVDAVLRDDLQAMLRRVEYVVPDEWRVMHGPLKTGQARMQIHLADGTVLKDETYAVRGSAERPLTDDELADKFLTCAELSVGDEQARDILDTLRSLERLSLISDLTARLARS